MTDVINPEVEQPKEKSYKVYEVTASQGAVSQYYNRKDGSLIIFRNGVAHVDTEDVEGVKEMDELVKKCSAYYRHATKAVVTESELDPLYELREQIRAEERAKLLEEQAKQNVQVPPAALTNFVTSDTIFEGSADSNSGSGVNNAAQVAVAGAAKAGIKGIQLNLNTAAQAAGNLGLQPQATPAPGKA